MTKLEDLLYSLTTVLVRYHDSQANVKKLILDTDPGLLRKKSRECAINILNNNEIKYNKHLTELINECTNGYPGRRPFLYFILHEITFLKTLHDRKESFEPIQLEEFKKQVTQLLVDLKHSLNTTKGITYPVKYSSLYNQNEPTSEIPVALSGLINDSYLGNALCNSGLLLKEEVLDRFNITTLSTDDEIKLLVQSMCTEHQHALLIPELQSQCATIKEHHQCAQKTFDALQNEHLETQKQCVTYQNSINDLKKQIEMLQQRVRDLTQGSPINLGLGINSASNLLASRYRFSALPYQAASLPNNPFENSPVPPK